MKLTLLCFSVAALAFSLLVAPSNVNAQARIQIVHASPDLACDSIDIWINNTLFARNFGYLNVSSIINVRDTTMQIRVKRYPSSDTSNPIVYRLFTPQAGKDYYLVGNGTLNPAISPNPDGQSTQFNITIVRDTLNVSQTNGFVQFRFLHFSPDASSITPTLGSGSGPITQPITYGRRSSWVTLPPNFYSLALGDGRGLTLGTFSLPFSQAADSVFTIFAVGFANPNNNVYGARFALLAFLPSSTRFILQDITVANEISLLSEHTMQVIPNPAIASGTLLSGIPVGSTISIFDQIGRPVRYYNTITSKSTSLQLSLQGLAPGAYQVQAINPEGKRLTTRFFL
jgi:hypothetical protein